MLALAFVLSLVGLVVSAAAGLRTAFRGLALIGFLSMLADSLKHVPGILPGGRWRSGFSSEFLALGLRLSGILTCVTSLSEWKGVG